MLKLYFERPYEFSILWFKCLNFKLKGKEKESCFCWEKSPDFKFNWKLSCSHFDAVVVGTGK